MRILSFTMALLFTLLLSACDLWPTDLGALADSITQRVGGETTAWRVGGDVVVIDVANSPAYRSTVPELEALATEFAGQAVGASDTPLESSSAVPWMSNSLRARRRIVSRRVSSAVAAVDSLVVAGSEAKLCSWLSVPHGPATCRLRHARVFVIGRVSGESAQFAKHPLRNDQQYDRQQRAYPCIIGEFIATRPKN